MQNLLETDEGQNIVKKLQENPNLRVREMGEITWYLIVTLRLKPLTAISLLSAQNITISDELKEALQNEYQIEVEDRAYEEGSDFARKKLQTLFNELLKLPAITTLPEDKQATMVMEIIKNASQDIPLSAQ